MLSQVEPIGVTRFNLTQAERRILFFISINHNNEFYLEVPDEVVSLERRGLITCKWKRAYIGCTCNLTPVGMLEALQP